MKHFNIALKKIWHWWIGSNAVENAVALDKTFDMENSSDLSQCLSHLALLLNWSINLNISRIIVCGSVINSKAPSVHKSLFIFLSSCYCNLMLMIFLRPYICWLKNKYILLIDFRWIYAQQNTFLILAFVENSSTVKKKKKKNSNE